jgi:nucleotide-binding universal stress UspA family protein
MRPLRRILVPRDFSPPSEAALGLALRLAAGSGAALHLVHAEPLRDDPYGALAEAAGRGARLRERLKQVVERDRADGPPYDPGSVAIEHAVVEGVAPAPAVVGYAREHDVDAVVMGRHSRRGLRRAVLGSVAAEVVHEAPCPVLVVGAGAPEGGPVLVALDLSPASGAAVALGARLAEALGAPLDALHVLDGDAEAAARDHVEALVAPLRERLEVGVRMERGRPAERVVAAAAEARPAALVVGPRAKTGLARLLGSVAEAAVRGAPCPVAVAHAAER